MSFNRGSKHRTRHTKSSTPSKREFAKYNRSSLCRPPIRTRYKCIDVKVKSKIWDKEYIQRGSLILKQSYAKLKAVQGKYNSFTFQHNLQQWINAFHFFVAVYWEKSLCFSFSWFDQFQTNYY